MRLPDTVIAVIWGQFYCLTLMLVLLFRTIKPKGKETRGFWKSDRKRALQKSA